MYVKTNSIVAAGLAILFAQPVLAGADPAKKAPKAYVEQRTIDLGKMKQGEKTTARFKLENKGTADLHIERVRASCGCTIPQTLDDAQRLVEPGEVLVIETVFDSSNRLGKQRKNITVTSDDPIEPRMKLYLTYMSLELF